MGGGGPYCSGPGSPGVTGHQTGRPGRHRGARSGRGIRSADPPQPHRVVGGAGGQGPPVRGERHRGHRVGVAGEGLVEGLRRRRVADARLSWATLTGADLTPGRTSPALCCSRGTRLPYGPSPDPAGGGFLTAFHAGGAARLGETRWPLLSSLGRDG